MVLVFLFLGHLRVELEEMRLLPISWLFGLEDVGWVEGVRRVVVEGGPAAVGGVG